MVDLRRFFQVTNPTRTLAIENEEDRKYYIDFSSARNEKYVEALRDDIVLFSPDQKTCDLFTGHIGCGKSTELLRLKAELQQQGFHVVYFESDRDLEMGDIDVSDILLMIAGHVTQSLEAAGIVLKLGYFQSLFQDIKDLLNPFEITEVSCSLGIAEITAHSRDSKRLRDRLRGYLEPRTNQIIAAINSDLLEPAIQKLQHRGQQGLVVIIDNLDRVDFCPTPWGRPLPEYLFIDRAAQLRSLDCHVVYTFPLALLRFSEDYNVINERFMAQPSVLPMVSVRWRDGREHATGMMKLRQMVLARGFPDLDAEQRLSRITELFDCPETLDRLCAASGGHVRSLLRFLNKWIRKERRLPLSRERLEDVIREEHNQVILGIVQDDWGLLRQVMQQKSSRRINEEQKPRYQKLLRNLLILEYCDQDGPWFDINPILTAASELQL